MSLTPEREGVLLAIFDNQSGNIEYTKKRSYALLASYSAICAFIIHEHILKDIPVLQGMCISKILWGLFLLLTIFCCFVLTDNYNKIGERRCKLITLHNELGTQEYGPKDKGLVDRLIPVVQIFYVLAVFTLTTLKNV